MKTILIIAALLMAGCSTQPRIDVTEIRASCPALTTPKRNDNDAQTRRIAELEGLFGAATSFTIGRFRVQITSSGWWAVVESPTGEDTVLTRDDAIAKARELAMGTK